MITIDLDNNSITLVNILIKCLKKRYPDKKIYYRKSCSKGYHFKILGVKNNYYIRALYGDDIKRIEIDKDREKKGLGINVLFSQKTYPNGEIKKAGKWRRIQ